MKQERVIAMIPYYLLAVILVIGLAHGGSSAVTAAVQNTAVTRDNRIVIDAGHGGIDGGATSCTGVLESQLNLEISLRLNDLLHLLGYETVMIRTRDESVYTEGSTIAAQKISDLKERVRITLETENAILVSIHQNTFSDSRYSGAQVFYDGQGRGNTLAKMLQTQLITSLNRGSHRSEKRATGVYLMEKIDCPGILVECGFLSNPEEEAQLRNATYQQKLCCVIAATISAYLQNTLRTNKRLI